MNSHEQAPKPKPRRRRRTPAEAAGQVRSEAGPTSVAGLPAAGGPAAVAGAGLGPAPGIFPVETVRVPWSVRLGLVRHEVTADAGAIGPRRMLLRDSSGVLMVLALVVLLASQAAPTPAADGGAEESFPSGGGMLFPTGTLDLVSPTPEVTLAPGETARPTVAVTHATLPPWCANPTCTVFVTPSPSPTPTPTPTPGPVMVAVPDFATMTGTQYAAALAAVGLTSVLDLAANEANALVTTVAPMVGTLVPLGSSVTITTSPDVTVPPDPTITSGPAHGDAIATFVFDDAEAGVTFACQLDGGGYAPCASGVVYTVGQGKHVFKVSASDAAGNTSGAASWSWTVPGSAS